MDLGSNYDVRVVGIGGMGGVGKTALAKDVFKKISHLFYSAYFISTPTTTQDYPPSQSILKEAFLQIALPKEFQPSRLKSPRLQRMLVVFDDIECSKHFDGGWIRRLFGGGSRIIITSRDEGLLLRHLGVDEIHKVELLNQNEARRLFSKIVFKSDKPMIVYEELTLKALKYADGLPLAIQSVGSSLVDLSVSEWKSVLTKLQTVPDPSVLAVLKKSFDGLTDLQKNAFLDIACCFTGQKIDYIKGILFCRYLFRSFRDMIIESLIEMSLINRSSQKIKIHRILQQLAKLTVQHESPGPGKRSRIWNYEDFRHIMETNTGTDRVQIIVVSNDEEHPQGTTLNIDGLSKLRKLKILIFHNVKFSGNLYDLSNNLKYLSWHKYPLNYLPSNFKPKRLVQLIMPYSSITQLWRDEKKEMKWLENLNLRGSKDLMKIPHFQLLQCLERLDLEGCTSLVQLHPSIAYLKWLKFLNLRNCTNLESIPNELFRKSSLEFLNLAGCSKFAQSLRFKRVILSWSYVRLMGL
ncbi:disease resistance protein Roq1-like [Prosopis cineraria]|uniref:disease resistance protein Roq1-like n=1 Tax=Prosopis cineraria TaxID=364024 RepID=UPI00240ED41F|nr:disease resistance protein Roq1-like [Prosopis cineraria]